MDEKELPSSSDESDADFVPKEDDFNSCSGSEVNESESSGAEDETTARRKRKRSSKKSNKKLKTNENEEEVEEEERVEEEKNKIDVDALWADFQKDVNSKEVKKTSDSSKAKQEIKTLNESNSSNLVFNQKISVSNKSKVVPGFSNRNKVGGLSNILNRIGKKDKMSTLQKSQLDWNNFKKSEGIEEEIKLHNRGKDGYLEKQDFLQRTDLRQFEIEKDLRSTRRKF